MRTIIGVTSALTLLLKASGTLAAEPPPNPCGAFEDIAAQLAGTYHEAPHSIGVTADGGLVMLFTTTDGKTWTIVVMSARGQHGACVVAAGRNWGDAPPMPGTGKAT